MTNEARIGPARTRPLTALDDVPMKLLVGAATFALLMSSAFGQMTALHEAVLQGNVAAIKTLLDAGADVNAKNEKNRTPLHVAAQRTRVAAIEALLAGGAEIHAKDQYGETPLHSAVVNEIGTCGGSPDAVRLLLNAGADLNAMDKAGRTPLFWAEVRCRRSRSLKGHEIYKLLLDASTGRH